MNSFHLWLVILTHLKAGSNGLHHWTIALLMLALDYVAVLPA